MTTAPARKNQKAAVRPAGGTRDAVLRDREAQLRQLLGHVPALIWTTDRELHLASLQGATVALLELRADQCVGKPMSELRQPGAGAGLAYERALNGKRVSFEEAFEGRHYDVQIWPLYGVDDRITGCLGIALDVTESRERLEKVLRLGRIHAVLSGINSVIIHVRDRKALLQETCRIAVNQGGFMLAWAGMVEGDSVRPVAYYGAGDFLEGMRIPIREEATEAGPVGLSLARVEAVVCNRVGSDPRMDGFREKALERGCQSLLVHPLVVGNKAVACLVLESGDADFFDEEEMKLLGGLAENISYALEFIAREERLDYLAFYDPLTGLANRRLFTERLSQLVQAAREDKKQLAVLSLDIERFKAINDTLGLASGDEVLRVVSQRLLQFAGAAGHLARIGGDRFAMIIPSLAGASELAAVLQEEIWKPLGEPISINGEELRITARVGIAVFPDDADVADNLIANAEAAMKKAKASGQRYLFYTQHMGAAIAERLGLESRLRRALERQEFNLHYQPKVELQHGSVCGAEALLRWHCRELGAVPPQRFVPLLEETGLILEVGAWALRRAISDCSAWRRQGLSPPRVAVNVSPLQLAQPGFVSDLKLAAGELALADAGIDIEVTESMLMTDVESTIRKLAEVRALGVEIAIDDFGTGYSSLTYLARLPVNAVKIDRSFIVVMADSAERMSMVSTIITLAHSMNLKVVAEGVDSQEQLKFLRLLRCDQIQGYLFSQPLPAGEFTALLRDGRTMALPK